MLINDIDENNIIKSSNLIVEDDAPTISWEFDSEAYSDEFGNLWYGLNSNGEKIEIIIDDCTNDIGSGLYSIKITDNSETLFEKTDFTELILKETETVRFENLSEGMHTITVTVEDNAGNLRTVSQTFYIDRVLPESNGIEILNTDCKIIGDKQWVDENTVIKFFIGALDEGSGLRKISLEINNTTFDFEKDSIVTDENGEYIIIDTSNLLPDNEHRYKVKGCVTDFAGNTLELNEMIVYCDMQNPCIEKVTARNKIADKIINVLTFGVYSNNSIVLKAYVSDENFDSGIDYVTITYEGLSEPKLMTNEGNGIYSFVISSNKDVYENNFTITAYDKFGKSSITCPDLENALNEAKANNRYVMIERILPKLNLYLPESDGVKRTDGMIWYKSNKTIEINTQDVNSGIRNIDVKVNGKDILYDKKGNKLLKENDTAAAMEINTIENNYVFDVNYLIAQAGESVDGKYFLSITVTDNAGNVNSCNKEFYIDTKAPEVYKISFSTSASDGIENTEEFIEKLEYGFYFKEDFTVNVYVSDESASSGIKEVKYRFVSYENGIEKEELSGVQAVKSGVAGLTVPKGFKGQIYVEAVDNVGNHSAEKTTKAYVVDNNAPDINIIKNKFTSYRDSNGNSLYIEDNVITVEVTDTVSGIKKISCLQNSEKNYDRNTIFIKNSFYKVGDSLGDGWIVATVDGNIVTKAVKTFTFSSDDNAVILTVDATDNAINKSNGINSEKFTIDKTVPVINISFKEDKDDDMYYDENRIAEISVIERNFSAELIEVAIKNTFGDIPAYSFSKNSETEYVAIITFDEGDYIFDVTGTDLGGHKAVISFAGGNEKSFSVDKTNPEIVNNFEIFNNSATQNSFNSDKTVNIEVTEHNFLSELVKLSISKKNAGAAHNSENFKDVTAKVLENAKWNSTGDTHTISFTLAEDGVYQIEIESTDLAGNNTDTKKTQIFEIDKTVPVVTSKNGVSVSSDNTETVEVYSYMQKDEQAPVIEFSDLNIDYIKYSLTTYILDYTSSENQTAIKPVNVFLNEDTDKSGKIKGNKIVLSNFNTDGVYILEVTAVDKSGNESLMNINTYTRMIDRDVLACVMESSKQQGTGLYSLQYENGEAVSKRPDDFTDIKISVWAKNDTDVAVVLRDSNGKEINTNAQADIDDSVYGMKIYNFTVDSDFFKENFQNDTDVQMHLSVLNGDNRIDLGKIHIDNIAPSCDIPEEFKSWKWYWGEEKRTITITNISEPLDEKECKVYDNGKEIDFEYYDENNTIVFTLDKGWHNVGISLSDMAGNAYNIQEISNIHIGFFWLWIIAGAAVVITSMTFFIVILNKKKKQADERM